MDKEKENEQMRPGYWEKELVQKLVFSSLTETRKARRWGVFFKLLTFVYIGVIIATLYDGGKLLDWDDLGEKNHTALVKVHGVISAGGVNADGVNRALRKAFEDEKTKGVIVSINSPGGSPVQSGMIYREILRLREKYEDIPLHVVVEDTCASGGYFIAAAADKIYVDKASIIGSIGVLMNMFGYDEIISAVGVERRLLTAGDHKGMLDPFKPLSEYDKQHAQSILDQLHQQFITAVKEGRGDRLSDNPDLYSGLFWSGEEGIKLGLADELGTVRSVARDVIGEEELVDFSPRETVLERIADRIGASAASVIADMTGLSPLPTVR